VVADLLADNDLDRDASCTVLDHRSVVDTVAAAAAAVLVDVAGHRSSHAAAPAIVDHATDDLSVCPSSQAINQLPPDVRRLVLIAVPTVAGVVVCCRPTDRLRVDLLSRS